MKRWEWLFLVLGLGLFALLLREFGLHSLFDTILDQGLRFGWVLLPTLGSYVLFCCAWWLTLTPDSRKKVRFPYLFVVSIAGFSLNYVTPVLPVGGEPLKVMLLGRKVGAPTALTSVITYNAVHILSHVLIFFSAFVLGFFVLQPSPTRVVAMALGALTCGGVAWVLLSFHQRGVAERLFRVLRRLPILKSRPGTLDNWQATLGKFDTSMTALYRERRGTFWLALLADTLGRGLWAMEVGVMLRNVGVWLNPAGTLFAHSLSSLMQVGTFFIPYELGVKEGSFYLCLKWLDLNPELGVYLGIASRLREVLWIALGLLIMVALGVRRSPAVGKEPALQGKLD